MENRESDKQDNKKKKLSNKVKCAIAIGVLVGIIGILNIETIGYMASDIAYELLGINIGHVNSHEKPVIYLYSDEDNKEVKVSLTSKNEITCEYPKRENGIWEVTANKNGRIYDKMGLDYNYIYWEGKGDTEYDFSTGFCIKGEDSAAFLESSLAKLGLSREEENEFIVYWLPKLEANKYNLISFQTERYTDAYKLNIEPAPDNLLRVFMVYKGLDEPIEILQQDLESVRGNFVREGFYVVEWGGCDYGTRVE